MPPEDKQSKGVNSKIQEIKETLRLFFSFKYYLRHYWWLELGLFSLGLLGQLSHLVNPFLAKFILDKGILARNRTAFFKYSFFSGAIFFLAMVFQRAYEYFKKYTLSKLQVELADNVFKRVLKLSLRFFQEKLSMEQFFLINSDIGTGGEILADMLPATGVSLVKFIVVFLVILVIDYRILLAVVLYRLVILVQGRLFIRIKFNLVKTDLAKQQGMFRSVNEISSHLYFLKASGNLGFLFRKHLHKILERVRTEIQNARWDFLLVIFNNLSDKLFFGLLGVLGTLLVIKGKLSLGSLGAAMAYLSQGSAAYNGISGSFRTFKMNRLTLERIKDILNAPIDIPESKDAQSVIFYGGKIEFKEATLAYTESKLVLDRLSFVIPAEGKIALVGSSGRGKTTIINLLLRLYDPQQGRVLIDDYDLKDLRFKSIYSQMGIALQEPFLFNDSIANNIAFGAQKFSLEEIIKAAKIAEADSFILNLPHGYESILGEYGYKLSQGQKQRIAIARALIKRAKIFILDEAMSSLDSETEDKIIENIRKEFPRSTLIVVSHRLSTAKKMDQIYFLESSSRINIGTHQELIERSLKYKELFASQIETEKYPHGFKIMEEIRDGRNPFSRHSS